MPTRASASQGVSGLEAVFHEALHQWVPQTFGALGEQAKKIDVMAPRDLPHAMIFFTAGEAVRRVSPDDVPTADRLGIWQFSPTEEWRSISRRVM